ncbi:GFA family protein [Tropicimonas sp.]|uniref:GFA family protein n=1 Tax=Tropicimonas sp. TaxID=2067044 RepID=UPI003A8C12B7
MSGPQRASCLCGACSFSAVPVGEAGVCHCGMCRKWSGGMFIAVQTEGGLAFEPGAPVGRYVSSDWGERVFCRECGSTLAWQSRDGSHCSVSIQVFDDPAQFPVTTEIFIDRKPGNYALANETTKMTEAQVFEMYAPKAEDGA